MDQTKIDEFLQAYPNLQNTVETLEAQLRKAEKQIYALEEGLTALRHRIGQLEETTDTLEG
jgi:phage shock protein A